MNLNSTRDETVWKSAVFLRDFRVNKSPLQYLTTPSQDNFFLFPTTTVEIENEINRLNANKSTGPFSIPVTVLKATKHATSKPLEIIFNASFSTGIVPSNLKIAKVTPVFIKGLQTNLNNYRPISILSIFNKLLEKLMHKRILDFLEKKKVIYCKQFDFRAKHSTDHAILSIIDFIQHAIDCHEFSCGIFLDFSKAFDTVNHNILIEKLDYYGTRGVVKRLVHLISYQQVPVCFPGALCVKISTCFLWCSSRFSSWPTIISFVY